MSACDETRFELGAYVLGALEPEEAARVERHLAGCDRCRAELEELGAASALLRTPGAQADATLDEEPAPADEALARVAAERRRERRRLKATASAGGTALVAVAVLAVALLTTPRDGFAPAGSRIALAPSAGVAAAAEVRLSARPWGTQVDLDARSMPALGSGQFFEVWLVRRDGSRVPAGTFRPTAADGAARVRLAAAISIDQVARVGVTRAGPGESLAVLEAPAA